MPINLASVASANPCLQLPLQLTERVLAICHGQQKQLKHPQITRKIEPFSNPLKCSQFVSQATCVEWVPTPTPPDTRLGYIKKKYYMISGVRANDYSENACAQYIFPKTAQDSISASVVASTKPIPMAATASAVAQHELNSTQLSCGHGRGRYSALRLGNSRLATGNWQLCLACAAKWKWKCTAIYAKSQRKRGVEKEKEGE